MWQPPPPTQTSHSPWSSNEWDLSHSGNLELHLTRTDLGRGEEEVRPELVQDQSGAAVQSPILPKYTYLTKFIQKPTADKNTMLDYLSGDQMMKRP